MTPVRPNPLPASTPAQPQSDAARVAAQKAFFEMAMGKAAAPAPSAASAETAAPVRAQRVPEPSAAAPGKVLRPGSLLDIRV